MGDIVRSDQEGSLTVEQFAAHVVKSRFYKHLVDPSQAIAQIAIGQALGLPSITAITGVHVIEGKPSLGVHLISGIIKRSGKYTYRVKEKSNTRCIIDFLERFDNEWLVIGTEVFSMEDAQRAGLTGKQNWRQYPSAMLFARAIAAGARTHCPDIFLGGVYIPEEIPSTNPNNIHPDADPDDPSTVIDISLRPAPVENRVRMTEKPREVVESTLTPELVGDARAASLASTSVDPGGRCGFCHAPYGKKHTMKCSSGMGGQICGSETVLPVPSRLEPAQVPNLDDPFDIENELLSGYDVPKAFA